MVILSFLFLLETVSALALIERNSNGQCGQYDYNDIELYTIYNNQWGKDSYSGNQCFKVDTSQSDPISWSTTWDWSGGSNHVKSYANALLKQDHPEIISNINSISSSWSWSYTGEHVVANVAYDLFLSPTEDTKADIEVMIWVGALGNALPIWDGNLRRKVEIDHHTWILYHGQNKDSSGFVVNVYSFYRHDSTGDIKNFNSDIKLFLDSLQKHGFLKCSYYLKTLQAGTEAFTGNRAYFETTSYHAKIYTK